jgi:hypothetical protein
VRPEKLLLGVGIAAWLPVALLLPMAVTTQQRESLLLTAVLSCLLIGAGLSMRAAAKRAECRRQIVARRIAGALMRVRRSCMRIHTNPARFTWDRGAVHGVLATLRDKLHGAAAYLLVLREQYAPLDQRVDECTLDAVRALDDLADYLSMYILDLAGSKVDAVRYGLDPFSAHLSAAETTLSRCIGTLRPATQVSAHALRRSRYPATHDPGAGLS